METQPLQPQPTQQTQPAQPPQTARTQTVRNGTINTETRWYDQVTPEHFTQLIDLFSGHKKTEAQREMVQLVMFYVFACLIVAAAVVCGYLKVMDSCSTGTIIAAVVGYVFGKKSE